MVNYFFTLTHFCETHGPTSLLNSRKHKAAIYQDLIENSLSCQSCKLILPGNADDANYFLTKDSRYISSKFYNSPILNEKLKAILVRSLSEESISKISFFGDSNLMYSVSRVFTIKDSMARGKVRKFSLIITSDNQNSLMLNLDKINDFFHYLIKVLKKSQLLIENEAVQQQKLVYNTTSTSANNSCATSAVTSPSVSLMNEYQSVTLSSMSSLSSTSDAGKGSPQTPSRSPSVVNQPSSSIIFEKSDDSPVNSDSSNVDGGDSTVLESVPTSPNLSKYIKNQSIQLRNLADILKDDKIYLKIHLIASVFLDQLYGVRS